MKQGVREIEAKIPELRRLGNLETILGSVLHAPCGLGNLNVVEMLVKRNSSLEVVESRHGQSPLFFANDLRVCELLISRGAKVNSKNIYNETPLYRVRSAASMLCLLENSAKTKVRPAHGLGLVWSNLESLLLQDRMQPNRFNKRYEDDCYAKVLDRYVADRIDINTAHSADNTTPLMLAALLDFPKTVKKLLDFGADLSAKNREGKNAFDLSSRSSAVRQLLR